MVENVTFILKISSIIKCVHVHWTWQRYHRLFVNIHRQSFSHIIGILVHISRLVLQHSSVDSVAKLLVEGDGDGVAHSNKQINKITVL